VTYSGRTHEHGGFGISRLVLLVEEDDDARSMWKLELEDRGQFVVEARIIQEALAALRTSPPDVIAIDVGTGLRLRGVGQRLRQESQAGRAPIIALVDGVSAGDESRRARAAGVDAVLPRRCSADTLLAEIQRLLPPGDGWSGSS
jgi:CheY-like chemotaxis protein